MKCPVPDCKGYLVIQTRHSDMHPFIACSNYYVAQHPERECSYTESLTSAEIERLKAHELTEREVIEQHYRNKAE